MEIIHVSKNPELRILKTKRPLETNNNSVNSIKKCLFGMPKLEDVEELLQQQIQNDWDRIKNRFGIDMEDIENFECQRYNAPTPKKRKMMPAKSKSNPRRRRLFQQQDRKITDFYQVRKNIHEEEKKEN